MSTSDYWCKTCGGYLSTYPKHVCPPKFECRFDEKDKTDRDWCEVYAIDAESAAEKFADKHDCENEYRILELADRCEEVIEVKDATGAITLWNIRAESIPHYYAEKIEAEDRQ